MLTYTCLQEAVNRSIEHWDRDSAIPGISKQQLFRAAALAQPSSQLTLTHAAFWLAVVTTFVKSCSGSQRETGGGQRQSLAPLRFSFAVRFRTDHTTRGSLKQAGAM